MVKIIRLGLILMVFCALSAGGLAYIYLLTQPQIELNAKLAREQAEREVLPENGQGQVILVAPKGYSGKIEMLVGVDSAGRVSGAGILKQKETPGLGANIMKAVFLKQFIGKAAGDPLEPKKDIDAITGATISTKAVCAGVKQALQQAGKKQ